MSVFIQNPALFTTLCSVKEAESLKLPLGQLQSEDVLAELQKTWGHRRLKETSRSHP